MTSPLLASSSLLEESGIIWTGNISTIKNETGALHYLSAQCFDWNLNIKLDLQYSFKLHKQSKTKRVFAEPPARGKLFIPNNSLLYQRFFSSSPFFKWWTVFGTSRTLFRCSGPIAPCWRHFISFRTLNKQSTMPTCSFGNLNVLPLCRYLPLCCNVQYFWSAHVIDQSEQLITSASTVWIFPPFTTVHA